MYKKKSLKLFLIALLLIFTLLIFFKFFNKDHSIKSDLEVKSSEEDTYSTNTIDSDVKSSEDIYSSNIISEVSFASKDARGNIYSVSAKEGEVDFSDNKTIYLKKIEASVKLIDSTSIMITSDFGKYNTENFNTIFSKNVIINYLDNKITAEYVDYSMKDNLMSISKNVVYSNLESTMTADVLEMNVSTKDVKVYMREDQKKIKIKSKN